MTVCMSKMGVRLAAEAGTTMARKYFAIVISVQQMNAEMNKHTSRNSACYEDSRDENSFLQKDSGIEFLHPDYPAEKPFGGYHAKARSFDRRGVPRVGADAHQLNRNIRCREG